MKLPSLRPALFAVFALAGAHGLAVTGCSSDDVDNGNAHFTVRESVAQLHITHATPGAELAVFDATGAQVQAGTADKLGSLVFRQIKPGSGYVVRPVATPSEHTRKLEVMSVDDSRPPVAFYKEQKLTKGFGYIKTRDGTELSVYVTFPGDPEDGPFPTIVDYSGYDPSKPGIPLGDYASFCHTLPTLCDAPSDPSALIASLFGYATVSVNMRGTGCSGGAYDYFEELQLLDGYDVIETVAAQPWVLHNKVGMTGLSHPGISQLFVGAQQPPSLAAITPFSVIGNSSTTLSPGGILNDGFAISWVKHVLDRAEPYGQGWEKARVDAGDKVCAENQLLHGQKIDNMAVARKQEFYDPAIADPLNPEKFVDRIGVPVFLAGAWQDEQTGPFFTTLLDRFKHSPLLRATLYNGVHVDAFSPSVLTEWKIFLDLYVAQRLPHIEPLLFTIAPNLFETIFKVKMDLQENRFAHHASYEEARAAYESEPPIRVLFENGGGPTPGAPVPTFERGFARWPAPETKPVRFFLQGDGSLGDIAPTEVASASAFKLDPDAGQRGILAPNGNVWDPLPAYAWAQPDAGKATVFVGAPLATDMVMLGTGSVDLWVKSTEADADLEVNLSEVRPDGQEMFVQSGWLRASFRHLGSDSTELSPAPTYLHDDVAPLAAGSYEAVRVPLASFAHVFRAGSRIRVSVDTPGDSRAEWRFLLKTFSGEVTYAIAHEVDHPSSVVLPLLEGMTAPSPLPACPSLRGQQCRAFAPYTNVAAP
ncbi:MAG: Cocaine esterase [Myxococcaceae bacterium]|nr:Cocaine esterase [Myxococcaceae bacterium]